MTKAGITLAVFCSLFVLNNAQAATTLPAQVNYRVLLDHSTLIIHKNDSYTMQVERIVEPLNATGVQNQSQVNIAYPGNFAKLKIIKAYTEDPDGMRHPVIASEIFKQSTRSAIAAPFLSDGVNESVIFPAVSPGDTIHIQYDLTYAHPYLPGIYALSAVLDPGVMISKASIAMDTAQMKQLQIHQSSSGNGWQTGADEFSGSVNKVSVPPLGTPAPSQYAGVAVLSTADNWKTLAEAYNQLAAPSSEVTPEIHAAALKIAEGHTGMQAITNIYHWIQQNIHSVSVNYETAGFKPLPAQETLQRGVGDSNAKVALMCAMVHSLGIEAVPAMVSQSSRFKEYPGVDPFAFDHFLIYLPKEHRFMDLAYRHASADVLPVQDAGRPVLITGKNPEMTTTPSPEVNLPLLSQTDDFTLKGSVLSGTEELMASGYMAQKERAALSGLKGRRLLKVIRDAFYTQGGVGEVHTVAFRYRHDLQKPLGIRLSLNRAGEFVPGKVFSISLPKMHHISADLVPFASTQQRSTPSLTTPVNLDFTLKIKVPEGYHPLYLPDSESLKTSVGDYKVSYAFKNGIFTEHKSLLIKHFIVSSKAFPDLHEIAALALESDHQALVLEKSA
ncbi:hypothetical protein A6M27_19805 [Acidithiobacillus thiooxidans]|uniref:DUF3857 domain-containing protein n=1 Tax=Acidithiobacillus thiooxidans TaxID=930 RepID=A0A1C2IE12_ACITH|nr:DUF3857 domain-containing protein [Acidithiobacillus thiooxidans]OCX69316.1 hypothetical protein A6O24_18770 [Acidithiobacillus thiooxidans]OCX72958.1 hypothetical protein A6P07_09080 [Acidithiobacillus thiooxidans]OCX74228.1 hypothetical protein A6M23_06585 [Acidithiobacillus thiooxidans]OCX77764.1 hypothetical protein A6O26_19030 [Acidithiobacillus thiooxidans]OCX81235.1 hypothetical protein A6M27_19805 [Acidithiobacillus thiooxidans]